MGSRRHWYVLLTWLLTALPWSGVSAEHPLASLQPGEWYEFPDSQADGLLMPTSDCPDANVPKDNRNPREIFSAYNGGAFDTKRNRLMIFGGGHAAYGGNDILGFDVDDGRWVRITCPYLSPDDPTSVHSYDQLEYLPDQDAFFTAGGSRYGDGDAVKEAWMFDLAANRWQRKSNIPGSLADVYEYNMTSAYDPDSRQVIMVGLNSSASFDPATDTWRHHKNDTRRHLGTTGALDPVNDKYVWAGRRKAEIYDVASDGKLSNRRDLTAIATGPDAVVTCREPPGLDYDPVSGKLVGWCGGPDVYTLDVSTSKPVWRRHTSTGGATPEDPKASTRSYKGTFGRWRYVPDYDVFVVAYSATRNVFAYRLPEGRGGASRPVKIPVVQPAAAVAIETRNDAGQSTLQEQQRPREPATLPAPRRATAPERREAATRLRSPASAAPTDGAEADWLARATAPGVVMANNFNTRADWLDNQADKRRCNPAYAPACRDNAWDTEIKVSGGGSVRFDVNPGTGEGGSGNVALNFSADLQTQFGPNEEFWLQWRQRMEPYFIEHTFVQRCPNRNVEPSLKACGKTNWKQLIIAQGDILRPDGTVLKGGACSEFEFVIANRSNRGYPSAYIDCGAYAGVEDADPYIATGVFSAQNQRRGKNGVNNCIFFPKKGPHANEEGCFWYKPDQWMTFMVHLKMGPAGVARDSVTNKDVEGITETTYDFYAAYEGEPFVHLHHQEGIVLRRGTRYKPDAPGATDPNYDSDPGYHGGGRAATEHPYAEYGKVWLHAFITKKAGRERHEPTSTWFDEVIVSTQPIAAPGSVGATTADRSD